MLARNLMQESSWRKKLGVLSTKDRYNNKRFRATLKVNGADNCAKWKKKKNITELWITQQSVSESRVYLRQTEGRGRSALCWNKATINAASEEKRCSVLRIKSMFRLLKAPSSKASVSDGSGVCELLTHITECTLNRVVKQQFCVCEHRNWYLISQATFFRGKCDT